MNALQTMATIFLSMALVSMGGAISSFIGKVDSWRDVDIRQIVVAGLFLGLFFLLRIKMYLDDLEILGGTGKFKWAVFWGMFSWLLWVVSATNMAIPDIGTASLILAIAIFLSAWALFRAPKVIGCEKKHRRWKVFNFIYIILLLGSAASAYFNCLIGQAIILAICISTIIWDYWCSDSLAVIDKLVSTKSAS